MNVIVIIPAIVKQNISSRFHSLPFIDTANILQKTYAEIIKLNQALFHIDPNLIKSALDLVDILQYNCTRIVVSYDSRRLTRLSSVYI